jgi:hypothetical protein
MPHRSKVIHWERKLSLLISGNHFSVYGRQLMALMMLNLLWLFIITVLFSLALQPSAGYGLLWLCSPARAMASCGFAAQRGLWPPRPRGFLISHNDAPQSVGLLRTSDQPAAETYTWQHTQQTNIHAAGGIRTHDRSRREAIDLRLRPRAHWNRQFL